MLILTVNFKASMSDIVIGRSTGVVRQYMVSDGNTGKFDDIVCLADNLSKKCDAVFVEVKFESKYSQREKRLEVVAKDGNRISVCKISNVKKFDKDSLELNSVCQELRSLFGTCMFIPIVYLKVSDVSFYQESVNNMGLSVIIKEL